MLAINWRRAHAQRSGFKRLQDSCRVDTLHSGAVGFNGFGVWDERPLPHVLTEMVDWCRIDILHSRAHAQRSGFKRL